MTTWQVRNVAPETRERIAKAAQVRGITVAEYLDRMASMIAAARITANHDPNGIIAAMLAEYQLETVKG